MFQVMPMLCSILHAHLNGRGSWYIHGCWGLMERKSCSCEVIRDLIVWGWMSDIEL